MAVKPNRFILVYRDEASLARRLVDELNVDNVEVITYHGETDPSHDFYRRIAGSPDAEVALVRVKDKFRRRAEPECAKYGFRIVNSFSSMKVAESALRSWLAPQIRPERALVTPRDAFLAAAQGQPRLIIAQNALDFANSLSELRYVFANDAAIALADYAQHVGTHVGDLSEFFLQYGIQHALNGQIIAQYKVTCDGRVVLRSSTEQHLTKGNHTNRNNAARVYFDTITFAGSHLVVVLYCGPHPVSGFPVEVDLTYFSGC